MKKTQRLVIYLLTLAFLFTAGLDQAAAKKKKKAKKKKPAVEQVVEKKEPKKLESIKEPADTGLGLEVTLAPGMQFYDGSIGMAGNLGVSICLWDMLRLGAGGHYNKASDDDVEIDGFGGYAVLGYVLRLPFDLRLIPSINIGALKETVEYDGGDETGTYYLVSPTLLLDYMLFENVYLGLSGGYTLYKKDITIKGVTTAVTVSYKL